MHVNTRSINSTGGIQRYILRCTENVPLVEFMYLLFTRMPGASYRRQLRSLLLYLCYVFRSLINSLVWLFLFTSVCSVVVEGIFPSLKLQNASAGQLRLCCSTCEGWKGPCGSGSPCSICRSSRAHTIVLLVVAALLSWMLGSPSIRHCTLPNAFLWVRGLCVPLLFITPPHGQHTLCSQDLPLFLESGCCAEFRSCVKVEVAVLGSPSLIILMVSVDVKQHWTWSSWTWSWCCSPRNLSWLKIFPT